VLLAEHQCLVWVWQGTNASIKSRVFISILRPSYGLVLRFAADTCGFCRFQHLQAAFWAHLAPFSGCQLFILRGTKRQLPESDHTPFIIRRLRIFGATLPLLFERQILRRYLALLIWTIYGEYEITWRLIN
jgi:hypothetical protein